MSDSDQDKAEKPVKLVHYTTAEAAYSILSKGELWMVRINKQADMKELVYGYELLLSVADLKKFYDKYDECKRKQLSLNPQENEEIEEKLKEIKEKLKKIEESTSTPLLPEQIRNLPFYITCFTSTLNDNYQQANARYWHANVAIIFNEAFFKDLNQLDEAFKGNTEKNQYLGFGKVLYLNSNKHDLKIIQDLNMHQCPLNYLQFIKHPNFECEQEYRLFAYKALEKLSFGKGIKIRSDSLENNAKKYFQFNVKEYVDQIRVLHNIDSNSLKLLEELGIKVVQSN